MLGSSAGVVEPGKGQPVVGGGDHRALAGRAAAGRVGDGLELAAPVQVAELAAGCVDIVTDHYALSEPVGAGAANRAPRGRWIVDTGDLPAPVHQAELDIA